MEMILKLNRSACLVELEYGQVFVEIGERHFARNELVPYQVLGGSMWVRSNVAQMTAGDFVEACMRQKFQEVGDWPRLARDFVFPTYTQIFRQDAKAGLDHK